MQLEHLHHEFEDMEYYARETPEMIIVLNEIAQRSLRDPALQEIFTRLKAGWCTSLERVLTEGVQQKGLRSDLDIPATAWALMAILKDCALQLVAQDSGFNLKRVYSEVERWLTNEPGRGGEV